MNELSTALRRRTEAKTLNWTLLPVGAAVYLEARVRGVTVLMVWHSTRHRPDLLLHTSSRILTVDEPGVLALWDAVLPVARLATKDAALDEKIITGTALMADADGA